MRKGKSSGLPIQQLNDTNKIEAQVNFHQQLFLRPQHMLFTQPDNLPMHTNMFSAMVEDAGGAGEPS